MMGLNSEISDIEMRSQGVHWGPQGGENFWAYFIAYRVAQFGINFVRLNYSKY